MPDRDAPGAVLPPGTGPGMFADHRGEIEDLLGGPIDALTRIFTRAGAVRGNHVHEQTTQWTYVVAGRLLAAFQVPGTGGEGVPPAVQEDVYQPGSLICEPAGIAHAWRALDDCTVLVLTRGPRSGTAYETDTRRLPPALRLIHPAR